VNVFLYGLNVGNWNGSAFFNMARKQFYAIGLMSGTSLDGLDMAWCRFASAGKRWSYKILKGKTLPYSREWKTKLSQAHLLGSNEILALHAEYGHWLGKACHQFIKKNRIQKLDCIASHGHTIFHQPHKKFTFQLGDGNAIHAETGFPVVYDFRSLDVQLGGQGAPLVPVGDQLLFAEADVCLNLGGIANLSMEKNGKRVAFDICFVNMGLNFLAAKLDLLFDADGRIASTGKVNEALLKRLQEFYQPFKQKRPALAREHFENGLLTLLDDDRILLEDRLRTFCESIVIQIYHAIPSTRFHRVLVTGGGARNRFLIELIAHHLQRKAVLFIPDTQTIDFKEALVFALLGVLRIQNKINVLKSVTGATADSSSGIVVGT
jgi:anhydro-N-acetylmuramic acid kinase